MVALSKSLMIWWNFMVLAQLVVCCESAAIQQPAIPDIPRSSNLDIFLSAYIIQFGFSFPSLEP